ncbi:hypothetical protein BO78DRAFT_396234 [Aspergillus sclerotiicarbonarius CBS 121057]|uniref:Stc1 domain-containing protein n=1 Tax=Aspergillus sclerotiicarbonarius (strain CBS 121057 / IBT 28362) TaxID=1448318 RepID=A0A319EBR8_ASPSB|nr:hypothetical protein BO78DRAFT_396234 [Aspergillus sclerotiicarbonarius CBS 121057]
MSSRKLGSGPSAYSGGYSQSIKRQIDSVVLPEKIKCGTCKKFRFIHAFSNRQLETLRNAVVVQGARATTSGHARCLTCTGGSLAELKCSTCDQVKAVDEFAKNQRQARDSARCLNCVQKHSETEPLVDETKMIADGESTTASSATSQIGDSSVAGSKKRIQGSEARSVGSGYDNDEDEDDEDDESIGGGVFVDKEPTDENSSRHGKEKAFIGYDPEGKAHRLSVRTEAPDPPEEAGSIHSGWAAWGVNSRPSGKEPSDVIRAMPKKEPKFAKIRGYKFEKGEGPNMSIPEPTGQTIPSDDEEDDNELDSFL